MEFRLLTDAAAFAELAADQLAADPFTTNVIGVRLAGVLAGEQLPGPDDRWMAVLDSGVVGLAMHTPPFDPFVARMAPAAAAGLARHLVAVGHAFDGVNGEQATAGAFARASSALTGRALPVRVSTRMYRLDGLRPPAGVPGTGRTAGRARRQAGGRLAGGLQ